MGNVIELVARERTYTGKEVASMLGIGASTLRKWSMLLEQHGYWFLRDSQNRREYRQIDVAALQRFYRLTKDQLFPQEEAAHMIVSHQSPDATRKESAATLAPAPVPAPAPASIPMPVYAPNTEQWEAKLQTLASHVQQQDIAHHALLERMEKQEAYIRSSLKERDRRLTKAMNDILDAKVQLARMQQERQKSSLWHRLFRLH
ncbi:MerR family transcriptional regulator [Brevibacillus invocatus]|uniref:MerR family transcriptional regulator n=1 Tax=Brevibacillus invocatus TaxID=173959 RepID=A0A3M8BYP9_9BACL|nr:MerR family transcriptional regulator [Brevibacillus invocatus]RNB68449.1 MerR family transcriptional regulator [Brevibacillus invocatus]